MRIASYVLGAFILLFGTVDERDDLVKSASSSASYN